MEYKVASAAGVMDFRKLTYTVFNRGSLILNRFGVFL